MTKSTTYKCDLCGAAIREIHPEFNEKDTIPAVGIQWSTEMIVKVPMQDADGHICLLCLRGLRGMVEREALFDSETDST